MLRVVPVYINTHLSAHGEGGSQIGLIWSCQTIYFFDKSDQIFVITAQMTVPLSAGTLQSVHCLHLSCYLHYYIFLNAARFKRILCLDKAAYIAAHYY